MDPRPRAVMDSKPRILIVEDDAPMLETWVRVLRSQQYRVDGAQNARDAMSLVDQTSYDVALVDIMLEGDDLTDRGGVTVLEHLRRLREPTHVIVLSGQKHDVTLVRDILQEYRAADYVAKWDVDRKGSEHLFEKIRAGVQSAPSAKEPSWERLSPSLVEGTSEEAFIAECIRTLSFKGGYETLTHLLQAACRHLMPVLPPVGATKVFARSRVPDVFSADLWSKGQGKAVTLLLYGRNTVPETLEREWQISTSPILYRHEKAGLSAIVIEQPTLLRSAFRPNPA